MEFSPVSWSGGLRERAAEGQCEKQTSQLYRQYSGFATTLPPMDYHDKREFQMLGNGT